MKTVSASNHAVKSLVFTSFCLDPTQTELKIKILNLIILHGEIIYTLISVCLFRHLADVGISTT